MVKNWSQEATFEHDWDCVTMASWRKYPSPLSPQVIDVDVLERNVDTATGVLHTRRLLTIKSPVPWIARSVMGSDEVCYVLEDSEVNPITKSMKLRSKNVSFAELMLVEEIMEYSVHEGTNTWTSLHQDTEVRIFPAWLAKLEDLYAQNASQNAGNGRKVLREICETMEKEAREGFEGLRDLAVVAVDVAVDTAKVQVEHLASTAETVVDKTVDTVNTVHEKTQQIRGETVAVLRRISMPLSSIVKCEGEESSTKESIADSKIFSDSSHPFANSLDDIDFLSYDRMYRK